jgi:hypothetical protein
MRRVWPGRGVTALAGPVAFALAALAFVQGAAPGSIPPKLRGQTLDGMDIVLPDAAAGKVTLLVFGASKKAGDRTGAWKDHFAADFGSNPHVAYYSAALLESAPGLIRGMIRGSMRHGTPVAQRSHVVTSSSDEAAWKKYLDIRDDSLPAVVLLDRSGHVRWSYNGLFDADHYRDLKTATAAALNGSGPSPQGG